MQAMDGLRVQDGNTLIAEKGRCTAAASINLITQRQMLPVVALFLKVVCFLGEFSTTSISYGFFKCLPADLSIANSRCTTLSVKRFSPSGSSSHASGAAPILRSLYGSSLLIDFTCLFAILTPKIWQRKQASASLSHRSHHPRRGYICLTQVKGQRSNARGRRQFQRTERERSKNGSWKQRR